MGGLARPGGVAPGLRAGYLGSKHANGEVVDQMDRCRGVRSSTLVLATVGLTLASVAAGAPSLAAAPGGAGTSEGFLTATRTIVGTRSGDRLVGTRGADLILGRGGADRITPRGGRDLVLAGRGDDYVFLRNDHRVDRIRCGPGFDVVSYHFAVDRRDIISGGCEAEVA